jgi:periplasmic copper chaperone A
LPAQKMFALLAVVFLACLPVESYAHEIRAGELVIIHPWMPEPLRGAKAGVVYLKIQNTGQKPDELLGAESAVAESVTVHESKDVGGVVKMQKRDSVEIPPKGEIELKPMAIHLMLIGLKKTLNELDMFSITLRFKHAGNVEADVEVTAPRTVHAPHS